MTTSKKVMLLGWDAADWKVINPLMDAGKMPNLQGMIERGTMGNMRTLQPVLSPMLWTSIATGKRPYKHGIYGFTEPTPDRKSVRPMTNVSRRSKAVWNILNQNGKRSIVTGWWPSHPAEPINGLMVSDYFHKAPKKPGDPWPLHKSSVHPAEKLETYAQLRVHPEEIVADDVLGFVPNARDVDQDKDARLSVVMKMLAEVATNHATATEALANEDWDFAAIYYDAIDHFCHGFMKYHPPKQKHISDKDFEIYQHVVNNCYLFHDAMLGRLLEFKDDDTTVLLISDHGFHSDHLRPTALPSEPAGPAHEHRDFGILVAEGPGIKSDHITHGANLLDVAPTILTAFGLPVGDDMDGKPLVDMFETEPEISTIESWEAVDGDSGQHPPDFTISEEDSQEALEQLIALGYIERPDNDNNVAIENCQKELDYNLARAYMDGGVHGEAIPLLHRLYESNPIEFRFGVQLAACLQVMGRFAELKNLIANMKERWGVASGEAKKKLREIARMARERRAQWKELKKMEEEQEDPDATELTRRGVAGKPVIFNPSERQMIKNIRAVAAGNAQTLDLLAASVATAEEDYELALQKMNEASVTESSNPNFFYRLGNVYSKLGRPKKAAQTFRKGLEFDEFHPQCLSGLSTANLTLDRPQRAVELGKRAIGLMYHFPAAHYHLGRALMQMNDYDAAIKSFEVAIGQNPNFPEAHQCLVDIFSKHKIDRQQATAHQEAIDSLASLKIETISPSQPLEFASWTEDQIAEKLPRFGGAEESEDFTRCLGQPKPLSSPSESDTPSIDAEELPEIVIVSGLPRSGTSLAMQMLKAGGIEIYSDGNRAADESNPKGYFEADIVKSMQSKNRWVLDCGNQLIKVVSPLIPSLPQKANYKVVFMVRNMDEIVDSQFAMLERMGEDAGDLTPEKLKAIYNNHNYAAVTCLLMHKNPVCQLNYRDAVSDPLGAAKTLIEFLDLKVDPETLAAVVDPDLYRSKVSEDK